MSWKQKACCRPELSYAYKSGRKPWKMFCFVDDSSGTLNLDNPDIVFFPDSCCFEGKTTNMYMYWTVQSTFYKHWNVVWKIKKKEFFKPIEKGLFNKSCTAAVLTQVSWFFWRKFWPYPPRPDVTLPCGPLVEKEGAPKAACPGKVVHKQSAAGWIHTGKCWQKLSDPDIETVLFVLVSVYFSFWCLDHFYA